MWLECFDTPTQDLLKYMDDACDFIERMMEEKSLEVAGSKDAEEATASNSNPRHGILVHCELGRSRSSTMVIAFLMRKFHQGFNDVLADFSSRHQDTDPTRNFRRQLEIWEEVRC